MIDLRELFLVQSCDFGLMWKHQMLLGAMLVLTAVAIVVVPEILTMLVAAVVLMIGAGLIGSAWSVRSRRQHAREPSIFETFEW